MRPTTFRGPAARVASPAMGGAEGSLGIATERPRDRLELRPPSDPRPRGLFIVGMGRLVLAPKPIVMVVVRLGKREFPSGVRPVVPVGVRTGDGMLRPGICRLACGGWAGRRPVLTWQQRLPRNPLAIPHAARAQSQRRTLLVGWGHHAGAQGHPHGASQRAHASGRAREAHADRRGLDVEPEDRAVLGVAWPLAARASRRLDTLLERRKAVLHRIVRPPAHDLGDVRPLVPQRIVRFQQLPVLLLGPGALLELRVKVVLPSTSTLHATGTSPICAAGTRARLLVNTGDEETAAWRK